VDIAIVGLPLAGKTTIFNALTGAEAETAGYSSGRVELNTAVVDVPDPRVNLLSDMFNPRKTTFAKIQFNDVSGLAQGGAQGSGLAPQILNAIGQSDALLQVIRAFDNEDVALVGDAVNPQGDLQALRYELILSDLAIVERRIERIRSGYKKARGDEKKLLDVELALMERFVEALENERLIADLDITNQEAQLIRGFQFLTAKPHMVLANMDEDADDSPDLSWANHHPSSSALALRGTLEMEIAQLEGEDAAFFLESYGISEPGLNRMLRECYDLLGLMSFFTVGEDEVRAWTVERGATAVEAAGAIHSDLARGFIRAEVISYDDMIACGTLAEARKQGKLRLEGKDYVVQNGDILNIRFNV